MTTLQKTRQKLAAKKRVTALRAAQKKFAKLPLKEQRLAIAKDVIDQVVLSRIIPRSTYLGLDLANSHSIDEDAGVALAKDPEPCAACAIGSLFVCSVRLADEFSFGKLNSVDEQGSLTRVTEVRRLRTWFSPHQLDLIEEHFETRLGLSLGEGCDAYNRLVLIMRNIIENDGEFLPPSDAEIRRINAKAEYMSLREVANLKKEI